MLRLICAVRFCRTTVPGSVDPKPDSGYRFQCLCLQRDTDNLPVRHRAGQHTRRAAVDGYTQGKAVGSCRLDPVRCLCDGPGNPFPDTKTPGTVRARLWPGVVPVLWLVPVVSVRSVLLRHAGADLVARCAVPVDRVYLDRPHSEDRRGSWRRLRIQYVRHDHRCTCWLAGHTPCNGSRFTI